MEFDLVLTNLQNNFNFKFKSISAGQKLVGFRKQIRHEIIQKQLAGLRRKCFNLVQNQNPSIYSELFMSPKRNHSKQQKLISSHHPKRSISSVKASRSKKIQKKKVHAFEPKKQADETEKIQEMVMQNDQKNITVNLPIQKQLQSRQNTSAYLAAVNQKYQYERYSMSMPHQQISKREKMMMNPIWNQLYQKLNEYSPGNRIISNSQNFSNPYQGQVDQALDAYGNPPSSLHEISQNNQVQMTEQLQSFSPHILSPCFIDNQNQILQQIDFLAINQCFPQNHQIINLSQHDSPKFNQIEPTILFPDESFHSPNFANLLINQLSVNKEFLQKQKVKVPEFIKLEEFQQSSIQKVKNIPQIINKQQISPFNKNKQNSFSYILINVKDESTSITTKYKNNSSNKKNKNNHSPIILDQQIIIDSNFYQKNSNRKNQQHKQIQKQQQKFLPHMEINLLQNSKFKFTEKQKQKNKNTPQKKQSKNQFKQKIQQSQRKLQKKSISKKQILRHYKQFIMLNKILGKGAFGAVYEGIDTQTSQKVAVKQISLKKIKNYSQVQILKQINHKNIIKLLGYQIQNTTMNCYLFLEFCPENLRQRLDRLNLQFISEKQQVTIKINYIEQLVQSIDLLNSKGLLHRDLKFENILVKNQIIKICDFGLCRKLNDSLQLESIRCGTPYTMAPEIYFYPKSSYTKPTYSVKSDIFSLAVVMHQLLYNMHPFDYSQTLLKQLERSKLPKISTMIERFKKIYKLNVEWIEQIIQKGLKPIHERLDWSEVMKIYFQRNQTMNDKSNQMINKVQFYNNKEIKEDFFQDKIQQKDKENIQVSAQLQTKSQNKNQKKQKIKLHKGFEKKPQKKLEKRKDDFIIKQQQKKDTSCLIKKNPKLLNKNKQQNSNNIDPQIEQKGNIQINLKLMQENKQKQKQQKINKKNQPHIKFENYSKKPCTFYKIYKQHQPFIVQQPFQNHEFKNKQVIKNQCFKKINLEVFKPLRSNHQVFINKFQNPQKFNANFSKKQKKLFNIMQNGHIASNLKTSDKIFVSKNNRINLGETQIKFENFSRKWQQLLPTSRISLSFIVILLISFAIILLFGLQQPAKTLTS